MTAHRIATSLAIAAIAAAALAGCGDDDDDTATPTSAALAPAVAPAESAYCRASLEWTVHEFTPVDETDPTQVRSYFDEYGAFVTESRSVAPPEIQADWTLNADGFAAKGVLHARLALAAARRKARTLDVFVTHLESRDAAIRTTQCEELARFIAAHRAAGGDVLVLGDFNIRGPDYRLSPPAPEHDGLLAALNRQAQGTPFRDVWLTHGRGPGPAFSR